MGLGGAVSAVPGLSSGSMAGPTAWCPPQLLAACQPLPAMPLRGTEAPEAPLTLYCADRPLGPRQVMGAGEVLEWTQLTGPGHMGHPLPPVSLQGLLVWRWSGHGWTALPDSIRQQNPDLTVPGKTSIGRRRCGRPQVGALLGQGAQPVLQLAEEVGRSLQDPRPS